MTPLFFHVLLLGFIQDPPQPPPAAEPEKAARNPAQDVLFLEKARIKNKDGRVTIVYQVGHEHGRNVVPLIDRFKSAQGWIFENEPLHLLVVTDLPENVDKIDEILRAALTPEPQVKIEVQVVEVRWTHGLEVGFFGDAAADSALWLKSTPTDAFLREIRINLKPSAATGTSAFIGSSFKFSSTDPERGTIGGILQAFVERGRAEVKSNPTIWVRSGKEAFIQSGEEVPFPESLIHPGGVNTTVRYKTTGVELTVTPHVVSKDFVSLDLNPKVTAVLGQEVIASAAGGTTIAPSFTTRSLKTSVIARTGEEIVIGGLVRKEKFTTRRGIPILMDIPLLGALFSRLEERELQTEIIFLLRPTVYASMQQAPRGLVDPARGPGK